MESAPPAPPPAPPPPPPMPSVATRTAAPSSPSPPTVAQQGPPGTFLVSLMVYDGRPFKDHWVYWVRSHHDPNEGVVVHATGDVKNGFRLEVKRCYNLKETSQVPMKVVPLQWVDGRYFNEKAMLNNGVRKFDDKPVCRFEESTFKVEAPGKSLNSAATSGQKIIQKDCQSWIAESAEQLVEDEIFTLEVARYLRAAQQ